MDLLLVYKSCTTHLLTVIKYWTKALEDGHTVDILYFDCAKAFDSVATTQSSYC